MTRGGCRRAPADREGHPEIRGIPARARTGGRGAVLWTGAAVAVAALLGARAHFWAPPTLLIYALLVATVRVHVVTDE